MKNKRLRCVLRCIRIPLEIDHKINQICEDREMNYSVRQECLSVRELRPGKSRKKTATGAMWRGDVWANKWARTTRHQL